MPQLEIKNDVFWSPTITVTGNLAVSVYRVWGVQLTGQIYIDGQASLVSPITHEIEEIPPGRITLQGHLTATVNQPSAAFKDFAHYPYGGIDPAMAMIGVTNGGLLSAPPGSYNRQYAAFTGPLDYPVSGGGLAWKRAAYAAVGFKYKDMQSGKHQILDAVQFETMPLASTGPTPYQNARSLRVLVKPTRLNYAPNPNFESGTTGWTAVNSATLEQDSFCWQGTKALKVTVPAGVVQDSGAKFQVTGLIPGQDYIMSARVAIAPGCGDIAPWSSATDSLQRSALSWRDANTELDPDNPRWRTVHVQFTATKSEVVLGLTVLSATASPGVDSVFWVDGVLVEEGRSVRPYFDGSMGSDYLWESGGEPNLTRSYFYENRIERSYLVRVLLEENAPLGATASVPLYGVLPTATPGVLTTKWATNPDRLLVYDASGLLATLTVGAKTVTVRGEPRTFTEQKRPFIDTFTRTTTDGFGQSEGGGNWSQITGTGHLFSCDGSVGRILLDTTGVSRHASLLDNNITDVDVAASFSLTKAPTGASSSVAVSCSYIDSNNNYRARVQFSSTGTITLILEKEVGGSTSTLGSSVQIGSGYTVGDWWRIRLKKTGTTLQAKAWKVGTSEPGSWTHTQTDSELGAGRVGLRVVAAAGSTAVPFEVLVDDYQVYSATWANPPTITHNTWVRTLDQPFDGVWTPALADLLTQWSSDTSDDVLAYCMKFITGAPDVFDPELGGKRIFGQANYGPTASDGSRIEGGDWNDYIGISWTYPSGEHREFPHGSFTQPGFMDCSGFIRMIYGRLMGLPMTYQANLDGLNIPRHTKNMGDYGPGVVLQYYEDAPPPLAGILPGDVVLFDADETDPVEGQIDHAGIYLGVDSEGKRRFISSRKTLNGPTFSDLGGASLLDGSTGLYATRLRRIRRF